MKLTGKLLDVNGRQGQVEFLIADDNKIAGWKLELYERDLPRITMNGEFAIEMRDNNLFAKSAEKIQDRDVQWEISLTKGNAAKYANQAFSGTYHIEGAKEELPVSQGVLIVWEFG